MQKNLENRLVITLSITLAILIAELVGGIISNSLALLSDAGHVFTDAFALGLSLVAARISRKPQDSRATYGYHRVALLAAAINGLSLVGIAGFIFYESYERFMDPPEINLALMMPVAIGGLLANILMVWILGHGEHGRMDLNIKSAWLHVLGDTLSSVGVIVSGVVIYFTGWRLADPVAGLMIGVIIIIGGTRVLRESMHILLDLAPARYDVEQIAGDIEKMEGVRSVHDVHLRSLSHRRFSFSAHVCVEDMLLSEAGHLRGEIEKHLHGIGIGHVLIQLESKECHGSDLFCQSCAVPAEGAHHHGSHGHGSHGHGSHGHESHDHDSHTHGGN